MNCKNFSNFEQICVFKQKYYYSNSTRETYKIQAKSLHIWILARNFAYVSKVGLLYFYNASAALSLREKSSSASAFNAGYFSKSGLSSRISFAAR